MSEQATSRENFEAWFGVPLRRLMRDPGSGLAVIMVAFPLLERYLRQRAKSEPNKPPFNKELLGALPELGNLRNANLFWSIYSHGLLHHVAFSRGTYLLSHDKPIVEVRKDGAVWLNPNLFAKRVLKVIRDDFSTFDRGIALPRAIPVAAPVSRGVAYLPYVGTGTPTGRSGQ